MVAHNERVKRTVPPERLLVWQAADGWEPLCEFLELDVPLQALPHLNDRETFIDRVTDGAIGALAAWQARRVEVAAAEAAG
jgi:hypothetical protein